MSIVMMSHLSDIQSGCMSTDDVNIRINFVKFLIMKYGKLSNENPLGRHFEIDPENEWIEFHG